MKKFIGKIKNFLSRIIKSDTPESSKRFIAIWTMLLISYIVIRFTTESNLYAVLGTLVAFVLALLGVAAWEKIKNKNSDNSES